MFHPIKSACSPVCGGLKINLKAQVLTNDGYAICSHYAAGEVAGSFFFNGYFGGLQMAKAAIYGRIAAEQYTAALQA